MKKKYQLLPFLFCFVFALVAEAHVGPTDPNKPPPKPANQASYRSDCVAGTQQVDQEINNVRARLENSGGVWWDGGAQGRYIVPKVDPASGQPEVSSIFAGAVWIGGFDDGESLKIAAQTYGSGTGQSDFFPGPLTPDNGATSSDTCAKWDKFFKVLGSEIDVHLDNFLEAKTNGAAYDPADIPQSIKGWPGRGNEFFFEIHKFELPNTIQGLAPFHDEDGDGEYTPQNGDFPIIQIRGCDEEPLYPDEMYFWIYNDAGGIHSQTNGDAIGMEVQVQAFAYATNDAINDMTFQRYKLINRATESIDSTFFAMWVDPDLGCHLDDYIGCEPSRSLAYVYNQDPLDGESSCQDCQGAPTYCDKIPMLGVDYFRGPLDEFGEEIGMSSFIYYNNITFNPPPGTEDPGSAQEFYNLLSGSWIDGTPITSGGTGYNLGSTDRVNYVFPDRPDDISGWSMCTAGIPRIDPRTIQASGPFRLDPNAVNELIIGVVWVPEFDYPCPDIDRLLNADDVAQALFDNCFKITDGPDAPDACWVELDKEIVGVLTNDIRSNNYQEDYSEIDLNAPSPVDPTAKSYLFEGYKVFQLATSNVSRSEFDDPEKARLVYQVDLRNGISELFNWNPVSNPSTDPNAPPAIWVPESKVQGADDGIRHTFTIKEDQFALGSDKALINHKKYYYTVIAYAYNEYEEFSQAEFPPIGQARPYLEGRKNIQTYTVIPRPITNQILNAEYGDGPVITRLDGIGAGGQFLKVSDEVREQMFEGETGGEITYMPGAGPLDIKVYNPLAVTNGRYELTFVDENMNNEELDDQVRWVIREENGATIAAEKTIDQLNEQIVAEYGFTISIAQTANPGDLATRSNGAIGAEISYQDSRQSPWLTAVADVDPNPAFPFDYIKTGDGQASNSQDPNQALSTIDGGFFVPYTLGDYRTNQPEPYISPVWTNTNSGIVQIRNPLSSLNNVDIVLTPDKSKWSRCVVVETASAFYTDQNLGLGLTAEGGATQFSLRQSPSVGKEDMDEDGLPDEDGDEIGMAWFPGYAVDVETGERLNVFFGENSTYDGQLFSDNYDRPAIKGKQLGNDMMWNPSSQLILDTGSPNIYNFIAGGQHFIYVTRQPYDECAFIRDKLSGTAFNKINALELITWTSIPMLATGQELRSYDEGLIPNEALIQLRVDNAYAVAEGTGVENGYPTYAFAFDNKAPGALSTQTEIDQALAAINVVPNPYYGYSSYETSQFTTTVKITNLPPQCDVTIYSLNGKFIRQYKRNEAGQNKSGSNPGVLVRQINPDIEWNLKNHKGIPVASGVYLIHVNAPGLGERVIKWFGVARQFDPSGL
ncbi:MAG: hypothetical protein AAFP19_03830 [Bacteroidota bacterium]